MKHAKNALALMALLLFAVLPKTARADEPVSGAAMQAMIDVDDEDEDDAASPDGSALDDLMEDEGLVEALDETSGGLEDREMAGKGQKPKKRRPLAEPVELSRYRKIYLPEHYVVLNHGGGLICIVDLDHKERPSFKDKPNATNDATMGRELCITIIGGMGFAAGAGVGGLLGSPGGLGTSALLGFAVGTAWGSVAATSAVILCPKPKPPACPPPTNCPPERPSISSVFPMHPGELWGGLPCLCPDPGCGCGAGCGCGCSDGASCPCGACQPGGSV